MSTDEMLADWDTWSDELKRSLFIQQHLAITARPGTLTTKTRARMWSAVMFLLGSAWGSALLTGYHLYTTM